MNDRAVFRPVDAGTGEQRLDLCGKACFRGQFQKHADGLGAQLLPGQVNPEIIQLMHQRPGPAGVAKKVAKMRPGQRCGLFGKGFGGVGRQH